MGYKFIRYKSYKSQYLVTLELIIVSHQPVEYIRNGEMICNYKL